MEQYKVLASEIALIEHFELMLKEAVVEDDEEAVDA